MTATALGLLDDAGPLLVGGRAGAELAALRDSDRRLAAATDAGAGPAAIAAGLGQLAVGVAMLAALLTGVPAVGAGLLSPVELAVIVLTPLAAFEATSLLPAAAIQVQRSRAAAARVLALLDAPTDPPPTDDSPGRPPLVATDLSARLAGRTAGRDRSSPSTCGPAGPSRSSDRPGAARRPPCSRSRDCSPGRPGPSRSTGTTSTTSTGTPSRRRSSSAPRTPTCSGPPCWRTCASGAATSPPRRRPPCWHASASREWLVGLPDGLDTVLGPDARTVSGGERRRLLVARALVSPAPLLLVDEPAEHLDPERADALVTDLLNDPRGVVVVTHRLSALAAADEVLLLDAGRVRARGTHTDLLATVPDYRDAWERRARDRLTGDRTMAGAARPARPRPGRARSSRSRASSSCPPRSSGSSRLRPRLTGAPYGALTVVDDRGVSTAFVSTGVPGTVADVLRAAPLALGTLGEVPETGALRLRDAREHPAFRGIPPDHPSTVPLLGTSVRVGGRVFGHLYLSEKPGGFTEEDEDVVVSLAAAAGAAVANAHLYADAQRREHWLQAGQDLTTTLLEGVDDDGALERIVSTALEADQADAAALALPGRGRRAGHRGRGRSQAQRAAGRHHAARAPARGG